MTRAVAWTLAKVWDADISLSGLTAANGSARLADLALIEERVRMALPRGVLTPRDLRDAALSRLAHAAAFLSFGLLIFAPDRYQPSVKTSDERPLPRNLTDYYLPEDCLYMYLGEQDSGVELADESATAIQTMLHQRPI